MALGSDRVVVILTNLRMLYIRREYRCESWEQYRAAQYDFMYLVYSSKEMVPVCLCAFYEVLIYEQGWTGGNRSSLRIRIRLRNY